MMTSLPVSTAPGRGVARAGLSLLGSLKAGTLFRVALDGERVIGRETLIDGLVYLLLESTNDAKIVRLVPAD